MRTLITKWKLSGGSIAVAKEGRLVYARGFGYANPATQEPFLPTTSGRIGSASKTFTATAILSLVERGKLNLDATVFGPKGILNNVPLPVGYDRRILQITVRHLLTMTAGWDKTISGDVLTPPLTWMDSQRTDLPLPFMLSDYGSAQVQLPLQNQPGSFYSYLNTSPMHLAMILERITGRKYPAYLQSDVFAPIGIKSASVASLRAGERRMDEAVYEDFGLTIGSLYPGEGVTGVESAFGVLDIAGCAPTGGWVCTTTDLVRFWASLSGARQPSLVTSATYRQMISRPPGVQNWKDGSNFWFGFDTEIYDNGLTQSKYGSLPGTAAWVAQKAHGYIIAVIFNARDSRVGHAVDFPDVGGDLFDVDIRSTLDRALRQVTSVPAYDLFDTKYAADRPAFSNPRLAGGVVGRPFNFPLSTFFPGATFSAVNLPPGLSYNGITRRIQGAPQKAGNFSPLISATYGAASVRNALEIRIVEPGSPVVEGRGFCSTASQNVMELGKAIDKVLLAGPMVSVRAHPDRAAQVIFIDENDDLVQAEISGPGLLSIKLIGTGANTLQRPAKYATPTKYVKGRPIFRIEGATAETTFRYYALGRINLDAGEVLNNVIYDGVADAASLTVTGRAIRELCLNNARFVGNSLVVGIHAPGVKVTREISLAGLSANGTGRPQLVVGSVGGDGVLITGDTDLKQPNGAKILVQGLKAVSPGPAGLIADGSIVTPPPIKARFEDRGIDITSKLVHLPVVEPAPPIQP